MEATEQMEGTSRLVRTVASTAEGRSPRTWDSLSLLSSSSSSSISIGGCLFLGGIESEKLWWSRVDLGAVPIDKE